MLRPYRVSRMVAQVDLGYLPERANWLPSGSRKTLVEPHSSFLGSVVNWTPLDFRILAVAKRSSHQNAMDWNWPMRSSWPSG